MKYIINSIILLLILLSATHVVAAENPYKEDFCYTVDECAAAVKQKVEALWVKPSNAKGEFVNIRIVLDDRYNVIKANITDSNKNSDFDKSAISAVYKASPFLSLTGLKEEDYSKFQLIEFVFESED